MKLFSAIIKLSGGALILVAVLGFIAGLFDYVLKINGSPMPLIDGPMAIFFGVFGVVMFVIGFFMEKRAERNSPENAAPKLDVNDLGFIERALARTRRRNMIIGWFLFLFGTLFVCVPFLDKESEVAIGGIIFILVLAGLMIAMGGFMIYKAMKLANIQESDIYKRITFEPKTITRVDALIVQSAYTKHAGSINATLFISTKKIAVLNVNAEELELLRQYLLKHNPQLQYTQKEQVTR